MPKLPLVFVPPVAALLLAGCGEKTAMLPADPVDQAAACGVIAAAGLREAAGAKGDLPAEAQGRIFHYALLAGSEGTAFDDERAQKVFQRMPTISDEALKGEWQKLRPACATAFPATQVSQPTLPAKPLDSQLQCLVLVDFMRKALGNQGSSYSQAVLEYGQLTDKLDVKVSPGLRRAGFVNGPKLQAKRKEALAAATKLGPPPVVIEACKAKYG